MPYGRIYSGTRRYHVWVKGRKEETARIMRASSKAQAQLRLANLWGVKSFQIECVWLKDGKYPAALSSVCDGGGGDGALGR